MNWLVELDESIVVLSRSFVAARKLLKDLRIAVVSDTNTSSLRVNCFERNSQVYQFHSLLTIVYVVCNRQQQLGAQ